jgi:trimethylamine--corrinoid protein Co-methyltransferase
MEPRADGTAHRRKERRVGGGITRLPWRRLVNPFRPLDILSADQLEAIHRASLRILAEIGLQVLGDRAIDLLAAAGANIDRSERRVRLDPGLVEERIATAPSTFTLHARNPDRSIEIGGRSVAFTSVGGPAFVADLDRGRRPGNAADLRDYVRLIGALDVIHQEAGGPLEATDLPVETRHLDLYELLATTLDKTWQCVGFGRTPVDDAIEVACLARGVSREVLAREPSVMTVINSNSPLRLDGRCPTA